MAKPEKETKTKATEAETFKYGVEDIAEALEIKPASARVQLRNNNIKKAGKSYGWNSKADMEEVVAKLKKAKSKDKPEKAEKKAVKPEAKKMAVKTAKKTEDKAA